MEAALIEIRRYGWMYLQRTDGPRTLRRGRDRDLCTLILWGPSTTEPSVTVLWIPSTIQPDDARPKESI